MADATPSGETKPDSPKNEPSTPTTPPADNGSQAAIAEANKKAEQAQMRANQLENELKVERQKKADAEKAQLEEKEEFKALYEKTDAELKAIREEREAAELKTKLSSETEKVFKDYPASVVDVAKTAGIALGDDSEAARTVLKEKLDAIKEKVGTSETVTPNNPANPTPADPDRSKMLEEMAMAGAKGDDAPARKYIGGLDSLKEMKRAAGLKVD